MDYYLFYMNFEEKVMPIYCSSIEDDPIIEGNILFKGLKHLNDAAFPKLKVNEISLPKGSIKYYLKGEESDEAVVVTAAPKDPIISTSELKASIEDISSENQAKSSSMRTRKKQKKRFERNY